MNHLTRTLTFVITASVLLLGATFAYIGTRPKSIENFEKVGTEFYPKFTDSSMAKSLEVKALDDGGNLQQFKVEFKDGLWRIPSHHDYPAEAADRLASTALSLMGVTRESLIGRRENQYENYGVVDPQSDEAADAEKVGKRVTLRDASGDILADFIIGEPAGSIEDESPDGRRQDEVDEFYYVRAPEERETYKARINIDLSTRFSDWIEPDLLKLSSQDLRTIEVDNYELRQNLVNTRQGLAVQKQKLQGDIHIFNKGDDFGPWSLDGLNEETEELNVAKINELVNFLDNMVIAGVRPKLTYNGEPLLTPDFQLNENLKEIKDQQTLLAQVNMLQDDLQEKGFEIVAEDPEGEKVGLAGVNGQLSAVTKNGVVYTLYLGRLFIGDDDTIEIGGEETPVDEAADEGEEETEEESVTDPAEGDEAGTEELSGNKSRYVAIRVEFDPAELGPKPVAPEEPAKPVAPEGYDDWKAKQIENAKAPVVDPPVGKENSGGDDAGDEGDGVEKDSDNISGPFWKQEEGEQQEQQDEQKEGDQEQQTGDNPPTPPQDVQDKADEKFLEYEQQLGAYTIAMQQFRSELAAYESEIADYNEREAAGKKAAEELGLRFAEWFYVVPADELAKIRFDRSELVSPKEPESQPSVIPTPGVQLPPRPDIQFEQDRGDEGSESTDETEQSSDDDDGE